MVKEKINPQATARCDGIVCFAGIDWWYHSQGHSERQIMKRLVRYLPVLWINPIGMRFPRPGNTDLFFMRYLRKFRSLLKVLRKDSSGIWVYSPLFVPGYTPSFLKFNGYILNIQIIVVRFLLGIRNPSVWITLPTLMPVAERGKWFKILFNRCDKFSANPESDGKTIRQLEKRLMKISDYVLYCNRGLMRREMYLCNRSVYIGHGVDYLHFSTAPVGRRLHLIPSKLPSPVVGFYGSLDTHTIDMSLLIKVARKISPGSLLVVGLKAMDISRLLKEKNVVYIEQVPYHEIPRYAHMFDVGIMPWQNSPWIMASNPVKLKEYLAVGFPVVSIYFPELEPYKNLVYSADSHEQFLDMLDLAIREKDSLMKRRRRAAVSGNSWDKLAHQVLDFLRD